MNESVAVLLNVTALENDVFENIDDENAPNLQVIPLQEKYLIICEFLEFISLLVNISAYLFLAVTICRFKRLRSRTNIYILHLSILFVIFLVHKVILNNFPRTRNEYIMLQQISLSILLLYIIISFLLSLDWFLSGYKPFFMERYALFSKHFLCVIYGFGLIEYFLTFIYAHQHHMVREGISRILCMLLFIYMIVLQYLKHRLDLTSQSAKTAYAVTVFNIILSSLIPMLFWDVVEYIFHWYSEYLLYIGTLLEILWYNHPIIVIYMLGVQNKYFKMAYMGSFKRSMQAYNNADFAEESEVADEDGTGDSWKGVTNNATKSVNLTETSYV